MRSVRRKVLRKVKPKQMNNKPLTGPMLLEITKAYITAINSGGVPNIEAAWTYLCRQESQRALDESVVFVEKQITDRYKDKPLESSELKQFKAQVSDE